MRECLLLFYDTEMRCWYYDKKDLRVTPSIQDGIPVETERRYRKEAARFIMQCGKEMSLGHNTVATGVVYFHRFYMFHSFKSFPRYVTACCCLFLAGKVEETPKKARDIIKTARSLLSDDKFFSFGEDPKEEVMTLERILLQTIKFDLQVEHPYGFLVKYAKCLKGEQAKLQKMVQMAWNFVNDSFSTTVCLQWEPEIIAVAMIHLASKLSKFTVVDWTGRQPQHLRWWDMFVADVTMEILEDICHQVLDLFQKPTSSAPSPPQQPPSRLGSPQPSTSRGCSSSVGVPSTSRGCSSNIGVPSTSRSCSSSIGVPSTSRKPPPLPQPIPPVITKAPLHLYPNKLDDKIDFGQHKMIPPPPPAPINLPETIQSHYSIYPQHHTQMYPGYASHYSMGHSSTQMCSSIPPPPAPPAIYGAPYPPTHYPIPPQPPPPSHPPQNQGGHHHSYYQSYSRMHYP